MRALVLIAVIVASMFVVHTVESRPIIRPPAQHERATLSVEIGWPVIWVKEKDVKYLNLQLFNDVNGIIVETILDSPIGYQPGDTISSPPNLVGIRAELSNNRAVVGIHYDVL